MASPLELSPPQPAQVGQPGPPPQASLNQMTGGQQGGDQQGDQSLQIVTQHLAEAEQALKAAARVKPELSSIVDKFVNEVKPQAGQILFGSQPQQAPQQGIGALLASGMQGGMR